MFGILNLGGGFQFVPKNAECRIQNCNWFFMTPKLLEAWKRMAVSLFEELTVEDLRI